MNFRTKAFSIHIAVSIGVLSIILGALYLGWYRWPGWYLVGALKVAIVMIAVDVGLGPLATLVVANPVKPRREFGRDIAMIIAIQLAALGYGVTTLWEGRPLYYTFSADRIEVVPANVIDEKEVDLARTANPDFVPSLLSTVQWVWVPLPFDEQERARIIESALMKGKDMIRMPRYFKAWEQGHDELRTQLKAVTEVKGLTATEVERLQSRIKELGETAETIGVLPLIGFGSHAVAAFDRKTLVIKAIWPVEG